MMRELKPITVDVDALISVNKYSVDEGNKHIELVPGSLEDLPAEEFGKLVRVCPAGLYKQREDGSRSFDYAGCLECGTCRIICGDTILEKWTFPGPTMGVEYRCG